MLSEIAEARAVWQAALGQRRSGLGDDDLAPMGRVGDPRGAVNLQPDVIGADKRCLARVDPHAHPDRVTVRPLLRSEADLSVDRCADRIRSFGEDCEHRIPLRLNRMSLMLTDRPVENRAVAPQNTHPVLSQGLDQARRALDVGEEEGDDPCRQIVGDGGQGP